MPQVFRMETKEGKGIFNGGERPKWLDAGVCPLIPENVHTVLFFDTVKNKRLFFGCETLEKLCEYFSVDETTLHDPEFVLVCYEVTKYEYCDQYQLVFDRNNVVERKVLN